MLHLSRPKKEIHLPLNTEKPEAKDKAAGGGGLSPPNHTGTRSQQNPKAIIKYNRNSAHFYLQILKKNLTYS